MQLLSFLQPKRGLLLCFALVLGLLNATKAQHLVNFKTLSTTEGLPYGTINQIWQDKTGYIWLLGENGLHRFDGYEFVSFRSKSNDPNSISSSSIYSAVCDSAGNTYFETNTSVSKFNASTGTFKNLIQYSSYLDVSFFGEYGNNIWTICENTLYRISQSGDSVDKLPLPSGFSSTYKISSWQYNGNLFFYNGRHIASLDLKTGKTRELQLKALNEEQVYPSELTNIYFFRSPTSFGLSAKGRLFFLNDKTGIFNEVPPRPSELSLVRHTRLTEKQLGSSLYKVQTDNILTECNLLTGQVRTLNLSTVCSGSFDDKTVFSLISKGQENSLWLAGLSTGAVRVDLTHFSLDFVTCYNTSNSNIPSNNFNSIFDADNNVVWMNSPGIGLIKGEKARYFFHTYNPDPNYGINIPTNSKNVRSVLELGTDKLLVSTLIQVLAASLSSPDQQLPFFEYPVASFIRDHENNIWFSCWGKKAIYMIDAVSGKIQCVLGDSSGSSYNENFFRASWADKMNTVYFGTTGNLLLKIRKTTDKVRPFSIEPIQLKQGAIKINTIFKLCPIDDETLLIGSSTGVYEYNLRTGNVKRFEGETPAASQFNKSDVRSLMFDEDHILWAGTNGGGIFRYDVRNKKVQTFTSDYGLIDNSIYAIVRDAHKKIWISTNKGLCKLDPKTGLFQSFSFKDGISFEEFNTGAATILHDGRIVFGGTGGYVMFHPDSIVNPPQARAPVLLKFSVNNQNVSLQPSYHFKHNENYISFQFASLSQFRNDEVVYAYKLEGLDPDWIYCGKRRFTTYASLKPGAYTLKIKCTNYHGIWSTEELSIPITIEIPWFQSWYFISLLALAITAIIYGWFRLRLNQRTKLLLIRDSIARDLHDEIGSNLSTISIYSEIAKDNLSKNKEGIAPLLDKISAYTQTSQEAMSDIVWMIDSRNDKFENIILKMRSLASETIGASSGMQLHMQIDENIHQYRLGMKQRKNFYMIYKESLNNIIKYANCANVWINLNSDHEFFSLEIRDDGVGFDPSKTKGNGLIYMKKRAAEIPAELEVTSVLKKGTTIHLRFRH